MRLLKVTASALIFLAAGWAIRALSLAPYRHNIMKKTIERYLEVAEVNTGGSAPDPIVVGRLRDNVKNIQNALRYSPTDVDLHMELAALYQFLGRPQDAIDTYRRVLAFHRRPEIYRNMAEVQSMMGLFNDAVDSYSEVVAFYSTSIYFIPEEFRRPIKERIRQKYDSETAKMILNE